MCDGIPDSHWPPIGPTVWQGRLVVIEQCTECRDYRARLLDPDDIDTVDGIPTLAPPEPAQADPGETDEWDPVGGSGDTDDNHDELIR